MSELSRDDVLAIIRNELSGALANRAIDAHDQGQEEQRRAQLEGRDLLTEFQARQRSALQSDRRGLDFVRSVRCNLIARQDNSSPQDVARKLAQDGWRGYDRLAERLGPGAEKRAMGESVVTAGGSFVPAGFSSEFIEYMRPMVVAQQNGARVYEFNRQETIARVDGGVTVGYVAEGTDATASDLTTGAIILSSKEAIGLTPVSNQMLRNPSVSIDEIIRDDMARAMAVRRDLSYYRGSGSSGEPRGIRQWLPSSQKFNSSGTAAANKVADLSKAMRLVAEGNFDLNGAAWTMSPRSWFGLFATTTTTGDHLFMGMLSLGTLYGHRASMTASVPDNIATDKSEVYFGLHREGLIGLDVGNPTTIEFFPNGTYGSGSNSVSGISRNQSVIRIIEGHDIALRQSKAFALVEAVAWA